ncbi:MAG: Gldg family protein [Burkholderiaceae bacterium]
MIATFGRLVARLRHAMPLVATLLAAVAFNQWVLSHPWRFDLTPSGVYSIGPETLRVIRSLKSPVRITYFYTLTNRSLVDAKLLLEQYAQASPLIDVQAFDPVVHPAQAQKFQIRFPGSAVFETEGRRTVVNGGTEVDFTNGLIRAQRGSGQAVCFTDGHLEADPFSLSTHDHFEGGMAHDHSSGGRRLEVHERHGAGMARQALEALGYRVRRVVLLQGPAQLQGCHVLVIAAPRTPFLPREVDSVDAFMADGGRAVMLLDPLYEAGLSGTLAAFGVRHDANRVLDTNSHYWTDPATPAVSSYLRHKITRDLALTFFPGVSSLSPVGRQPPPGVSVFPLVMTSERAKVAALEGMPSKVDDDERARSLMVLATRRSSAGTQSPQSQLIVAGDGDFMTNSFYPVLGNGQLFLNAVSYLADNEQLIDIAPRTYQLPSIRLSNRQMQFTFLLSTVLMPLLAIGFILVHRWRRGR